jgi:hypothetical protein
MNLFNSAIAGDYVPPATEPPVEAPVTPAPAPEATPTPVQLLAGRFKTTDELVRGYQNIQSDYTRKSQTLSEVTKVVEQLKAQNAELAAKLQQPPQPPETQPTDEFAGLDTEGILEKFYADPVGVLSKMAEKIVDSKVKPLEGKLNPIVERTEYQQNLDTWNEAVTSFTEANKDMPEFLDGMKEYIAENNLQGSKEPEKVLKNAYTYAKGLKYAPPADPMTLLNDPEFVNKNILTNPAIKDAVLKAHMESLKGNNVPPTITGAGTGQPLATPPSKAKTMDEGYAQFESMIMGNFVK